MSAGYAPEDHDGLQDAWADERANVLPPTLEEAYAEGRKDERQQLEPVVAALEFLLLAILTRADSDYLFRAVSRADAALRFAMPGWTPPVPRAMPA